ncbi:MAG: Sua5/YciO/YrdC/YwlC family protein, partial [Deferribacterota bacterium]|nr:Sua5/YciO/YrdC/YwlC family protein [Deferribacterota bacterium]
MCLQTTKKIKEGCFEFKLSGVVQGVGFRPFVYKIAVEHNLKGWVKNTNYGLFIVVQGALSNIETFKKQLISEAPTLARIKKIETRQIKTKQITDFQILLSDIKGDRKALIPPDIAICPACVKDVLSVESRFYLYPFTNCTNCGPRFTIVERLPYDRKQTSMKEFPMCTDCAFEYNTMSNRRFHAQPIACNRCGPKVKLIGKDGNILQENWLTKTWQLLKEGKIIAAKGLGGFHLICKVEHSVIDRLRRLKDREDKPLPVMCRDLSVVKHFCIVTKKEQDLLTSPIAPIVVMPVKNNDTLPSNLTKGLPTLGVMLPYSPLHLLLLQGPENILIATSANISDLPLIKDNEQALSKLQ